MRRIKAARASFLERGGSSINLIGSINGLPGLVIKVDFIKAKNKLIFSSQEIDKIVKEYLSKLPAKVYDLY